jgi:hypothetical protein
MKTTMVALSAAALIAVAPATLAQNLSSKTPDKQHHAAKKHANGWKTGNPGAFGRATAEPRDYTLENSRQAGGGSGM